MLEITQRLIATIVVTVLTTSCSTDDSIKAKDAHKHIGETKNVCGNVSLVKYAEHEMGRPTFIDIGAPYPNNEFTVLVWQEDRANFTSLPETWKNKEVCVRGKISEYRQKSQIIVDATTQIKID